MSRLVSPVPAIFTYRNTPRLVGEQLLRRAGSTRTPARRRTLRAFGPSWAVQRMQDRHVVALVAVVVPPGRAKSEGLSRSAGNGEAPAVAGQAFPGGAATSGK